MFSLSQVNWEAGYWNQLHVIKKSDEEVVDFSYQNNQFLEPKTFLRFYIGHLTDFENRNQNHYQMVLQNKWKIGASSIGNETWFMNHSHLPNVEFQMEFLDCCSGWLFSLITKSKSEKNIKLINYFIGISDISKRFDYYDCNAAFCLSYIEYSNYCGGSYVDFLKQMSWLVQVSPAFKTSYLQWKETTCQSSWNPL